jgi:tetratricopeptide (TPR) repeat protein
MGFAGEITTIGLPELFRSIAANRLTGVLTVSDSTSDTALCFVDGAIRACSGGSRIDYDALACTAAVSPETVLQRVVGKPRRGTLRRTLQGFGSFDEEAYDRALRAAMAADILKLFDHPEASFVFDEETRAQGLFDAEQLESDVVIDAEELVDASERQREEWARVAGHAASESDVMIATGVGAEVDDPETEALLPLLDGTRDVQTAISELPYERSHMLRLVARLAQQGVLAPAPAEQLGILAEQAIQQHEPARAARLLCSALEQDPSRAGMWSSLAALYESGSHRQEAARAYKGLAAAHERNDDAAAAIEAYLRAHELAGHDIEVLERMIALYEAGKDEEAVRNTSRKLARCHSMHGRHERALDVLRELIERAPADIKSREALAATYIKLHEPQNAVQELLALAERAAADRLLDRALHYYRSVLAVDRRNDLAARRLDELEADRLKIRRKRRVRRLEAVLGLLLLVCLAVQGVREYRARDGLTEAASLALAGDSVDALALYAVVCRDHRFTIGSLHAQTILRDGLGRVLERVKALAPDAARKEIRRLRRAVYPDWATEMLEQAERDILSRAKSG